MTTNYHAEGKTLDYTAGADIAKGEVVVVGNQIGIAHDAIANGAAGVLHMEGVWEVPKTAGAAINQGTLAAYDASTGEFVAESGLTPATGDITGCCIAWATAASAATTVLVKINAGPGTVN